ncbi:MULTISPECIES: hypothetical protein [unclassified Agarivorans]|uniref:hypothetical protein n=1 Tax=unclassified Agarivorans TaxID=2636026 RepID=UPI0026E1D7DF|nr:MULTISPECIES: hypothetical protein [unclassified Agarivorans]MDO6687238.1 hypothetical protein [Agarivorans sp. 3_MG-2023]MDO6716835.1 hypothetical protein [Agarivorans sp. 2_MG-2023]
MDLLKLLKDKAEYFSTSEDDRGVSSVVTHIEIAERHYENGKSGDDYLFNDVIYRSNQAFEGALKEAYRIITGSNPNKITPHKIEKYFEENDVLKERVLQLFTNYRTEWRNKSTHDYKLYFSEQEAFLAIVNISAFINILLDQMAQKRAYDKEDNELKSSPPAKGTSSKNKPLIERVVELLISFSKEVPDKTSGSMIPRITEVELIGSLTAFLNNLAEDINVFSEYSISRKQNGRNYYADFFLQRDAEKLIIEIKNPSHGVSRILSSGTEQLLNYLTASGVTDGVLYIPPLLKNEELEISRVSKIIGDITYNLVQIYPKRRLNKSIQPTADASAD